MFFIKKFIREWILFFTFTAVNLFSFSIAHSKLNERQINVKAAAKHAFEVLNNDHHLIESKFDTDLESLPEIKPLLEKILNYINSADLDTLSKKSKVIKLMKENLFTSLFHLNLKPEINNANKPNYSFIDNSYPYDIVYENPFPKRPSLEFLEQTLEFIKAVNSIPNDSKEISYGITEEINRFPHFESFKNELSTRVSAALQTPSQNPNVLLTDELIKQPVDSYLILRARLKQYGEIASFPEFADTVNHVLASLKNDKNIQQLAQNDFAFNTELQNTILNLEKIKKNNGESTATQAKFNEPFPYRRTILAIERAVSIFDIKDRIKFGESNDWYEVENSWYPKESNYKGKSKLLPLYHYNRYKYQEYGLLNNPNIILFPSTKELSEENLIQMRPVPIGFIGTNTTTVRADRHHNSPQDFWYHDINHIRRMWGYDKKYMKERKIDNWKDLHIDFREREKFINDLLAMTTNQGTINDKFSQGTDEVNLQKMETKLLFETFHETALPATRNSLLNDIFRYKAVRQPFERLMHEETQVELTRTFDGNVDSGANRLQRSFSLDKPTKVLYYWDRAPNYIANIDNKGRWGFHNSVYIQRNDTFYSQFFNPENVSRAALSLLEKVEFKDGEGGLRKPEGSVLVSAANERSGQSELWNYWALHPNDDLSQTGKQLMQRETNFNLNKSYSEVAYNLQKLNPNATSTQLAEQININSEDKNLLKWMQRELERYVFNFDVFFEIKLARIREHHQQRLDDMEKILAPLKKRLENQSDNSELKKEILRLTNELKPHGFVQEYTNADDFIEKFVGENKKLLKTIPTRLERTKMNKHKRNLLYVDTWKVPFFNTGTQSKVQAKSGVKEALAIFKKLDLNSNISYRRFTELIALFARPEFDDLRRYKLQLFPSEQDSARFVLERSDAKFAGLHFPKAQFTFTNRSVDMDGLSYSFGQNNYVMGIISHNSEARADGRIFTGPADFLEHDASHSFFTLSKPPPGTPENWKQIHDEFFFRMNKEANAGIRKMMSLIYFHLTHESGYKFLLPISDRLSNDAILYYGLIEDIREKIRTRYYYDWVSSAKEFNGDFEKYLEPAFKEVSIFFKDNFNKIQSTFKTQQVQIEKSNGKRLFCKSIFK